MTRKILCVIVVVALPFLLEATSGCGLHTVGLPCEGDDCERPPEQSNLNSYVCSCNCTPASRHLEVRVTASSDDAEQTTSAIILDSPVFHLVAPQVDGLRFANVDVPSGAHITNAYVQFVALDSVNQPVSFQIAGEAADNGATFAQAPNNVSGRPPTAISGTWNPAGWTAGDTGFDQRTSDLTPILQEIVDRAGWNSGNAVVLIFSVNSGSGSRNAVSYDGNPFKAPLLVIDFEEPDSMLVGPQELPVCVLPGLNPNIPGGVEPTDQQLSDDCTSRVEGTLSGLSSACRYPSKCDCSLKPNSRSFSATCDNTCAIDLVDMDCADFDPKNDKITATNAPGGQPVCLVHSPLASGIFGRRTTCNVKGTAHVEIEGDSADPMATGVLQFRGTPCPGEPCAVAMESRLDIGDVTFGNVFGSETFTDLAGLGESTPGNDAVLSVDGVASFAPEACLLSARGRRVGGEARALVTANAEAVNISVLFGSTGPTCALSGAVVGSADPELKRCEMGGNICTSDSDCGDDDTCSEVGASDLILSLSVAGDIVNQPPTADAGADQTVECPAPAVLDASGSSDLDPNSGIVLYSWLRGSRTGPEVGFAAVSNVEQGLGTQSYVLRVIDKLGQTDEDTTSVTVVDTTPPVLSCTVVTPVLDQTNHSLVNVGLASRARDACEGELPVTVHIFGDEDDEMQTGDGNFSPDAKNIDIGSLRLRAERQGNSDGRVYLIIPESTDSSGNRGSNCCTVVVPHSHSQAALQSAQSQAAAAQAFCLAHDGMPPPGYFVVGDGPLIGPKQ